MCGFFISNSSVIHKSHEHLIEENLRFRGPDFSSGLIEHLGWKVYHSRLSIIGLEEGNNQPLIDSQNGLLVFNGEILNYKELGIQHFGKEYSSDTKLLSDLIVSGKIDIKELDGFFAFVYINNNGELKHAVRDPFGVKPIFYYKDSHEHITICSEANVIKKIFDCGINKLAIEEYYSTRAAIFSDSYFEGIKSVPPGTCLINGEYFNVRSHLGINYKETINYADLNNALLKGVSTRKVADTKVGLLLSKGVDSHILKSLSDFNKYYSIGFKGDADIEYLKKKNEEKLTIIECSPEEYKESFNYLLHLRGEPMSVPNEVLLYILAKKAKADGVKVLLSGEGADEFFAGYDRIFTWAERQDHFDLDTFLELYCYIKPIKDSHVYNQFKTIFEDLSMPNCFEMVRWFFIRYHMPILFRRLDFSLMAAGVEGREPVANMHTFLEAVKISPQKLVNSHLGKIPLRKLLSQYMGEQFAYEKKIGFPVDLTKVFKNDNNLSSYQLWFSENLKVFNQ